MRGDEEQREGFIVLTSLEDRVPADHPLRAIRRLVDEALERVSPTFAALYAERGRPSIAPEVLLRAQLIQISMRSPPNGAWSSSLSTICSCAGSSACRSRSRSST